MSVFISDDLIATPHVLSLIEKWKLSSQTDADFALNYENNILQIKHLSEPKSGGVFVDFAGGSSKHRRLYGGGKGQSIAKAIGLNKGVTPKVLDATAGLGRDAFVLASLGCNVMMVERNPVVAALLDDGLQRAYQDEEIGAWAQERLQLVSDNSCQALHHNQAIIDFAPEVIYLDPMYPNKEKKKSALVKKEMRYFHSLVGEDLDADELLKPALALASKRVVVKRPIYADYLDQQQPTMSIKTKGNRFDVYINASMTKSL